MVAVKVIKMYCIIYSWKLSLLQARYLYLSSGLTIFTKYFFKHMPLYFKSIHYISKSTLERFLRIYFTIHELNVYFSGRQDGCLERYGEMICVLVSQQKNLVLKERDMKCTHWLVFQACFNPSSLSYLKKYAEATDNISFGSTYD